MASHFEKDEFQALQQKALSLSAWMVTPMTALLFNTPRPQDRATVKHQPARFLMQSRTFCKATPFGRKHRMRPTCSFGAGYTASDFVTIDRHGLIAVFSAAAVEQHGSYLPLSVDRVILGCIIPATVSAIDDKCPALFLPTLPVGKTSEHYAWPATFTFSAQTLISMWMEICDSKAATVVHKLVLLNSHSGQNSTMDIAARDLRAKHHMLVAGRERCWGLRRCRFGDTRKGPLSRRLRRAPDYRFTVKNPLYTVVYFEYACQLGCVR